MGRAGQDGRPTRAWNGMLACLGATVVLAQTATAVGRTEEDVLAKHILAETGVRGGLVVHLGCGDGSLTATPIRFSPGSIASILIVKSAYGVGFVESCDCANEPFVIFTTRIRNGSIGRRGHHSGESLMSAGATMDRLWESKVWATVGV